MEDITTLNDLPEVAIILGYDALNNEILLDSREIFLHTPTAAIVEILNGTGREFDEWQISYEFTCTLMDKTKLQYTALLLNYNVPLFADRVYVINRILKKVAKFFIQSQVQKMP